MKKLVELELSYIVDNSFQFMSRIKSVAPLLSNSEFLPDSFWLEVVLQHKGEDKKGDDVIEFFYMDSELAAPDAVQSDIIRALNEIGDHEDENWSMSVVATGLEEASRKQIDFAQKAVALIASKLTGVGMPTVVFKTHLQSDDRPLPRFELPFEAIANAVTAKLRALNSLGYLTTEMLTQKVKSFVPEEHFYLFTGLPRPELSEGSAAMIAAVAKENQFPAK